LSAAAKALKMWDGCGEGTCPSKVMGYHLQKIVENMGANTCNFREFLGKNMHFYSASA